MNSRPFCAQRIVRDALPELQLDYLDLTEKTLIMVLSRKEHLTRDELLLIVEKTVKPLAEHLKLICDMSGIDIMTGQKLIGGGD